MGRFAFTALLIAAALAAPHCAAAQTPEDGQWVMPGKNHQGFRFSGLTEITPENVKQLKVAWTFSLGVEQGQEAAPIVAGNTMFVVTPYPNIVYALDLTKPGGPSSGSSSPSRPRRRRASPAATWSIAAPPMPTARSSSTPSTTRPSRVDAETGQELWRTKLGDITRGETMTMAPLVVSGKVLVGNSGGELGVRGWLTALDANTGKIAWRAYSTGPDKDVLIGRQVQAVLRPGQGPGSRVSIPGRPRPGRSAAAPCGAGSPTTRSRT